MAVDLQKLEELFHGVMTVEPDSRAGFLDGACEQDADLRHEVESLVAAYESGSDVLEENAVTLAMRLLGSSSTDSLIGEEIGPYKILSALGRGGMGSVYLAHDNRLNRKVALKFLSGEFVSDNWAKRQLIREAQAVARLDHPNICAVYGFDEIGEHSFIVMQYIEGQTLADLIRKKSVRPDQIVPLGQQIVSALVAAHAHGIIHRDIKPKNIMVTPSAQVKVLDFGLAKTVPKTFEDATESISQLSKDGLLIGTIAYMSPEQLRGEKLDYRSDIFSMGTVLYEMACGRNPYAHKTNAEVISAIMSREPESLRQVSLNCPQDLEQAVTKCLRKDPAERYQSATELLIDLDNIQKGIALPVPINRYLNVRYAAIAAVLLLAFAIGLAGYKNLTDSRPTLAVLPIVCDGDDSSNQCMGPTLTANLVRALSRRNGLHVVSSQVAPTLYGPQAVSPEKVGRDLNADMALYGRISHGEKGLVLTIRVIRVKDGSQVAEQPFPLNPNRTTGTEQWISLQTAALLQLPMNEDDNSLFNALATQQNENPDAVRLYLLGRAQWQNREISDLEKPIASFTEATQKDPLFAKAWAGLADCYVLMNTVAFNTDGKEAMKRAEAAAKKALEIDDNLAEAHTAYASVLMKGHWDWEGAEREFRRAIALNPAYSPAHWGYSNLLAVTSRFNESVAESEQARDIDPFGGPAMMNNCRALYFARRFEQADVCYDRLTQEHPNYAGGRYSRAITLPVRGRLDEAIQIFEELYGKDKKFGAMLGYCYGLANRRDDALRVLNEMQKLENENQQSLPSQEFAIIYLGLNDLDHAVPLFQQAVKDKYPPSQGIFIDPMFDRLRVDPRFAELARQVRLPSRPADSAAPADTSSK